jgi:hypothetical protein
VGPSDGSPVGRSGGSPDMPVDKSDDPASFGGVRNRWWSWVVSHSSFGYF